MSTSRWSKQNAAAKQSKHSSMVGEFATPVAILTAFWLPAWLRGSMRALQTTRLTGTKIWAETDQNLSDDKSEQRPQLSSNR
jgi:hypothetical protein